MTTVGRRPSYSRTSSGSSLTQDDTSAGGGGGRSSRVGRLSLEQLTRSSESSTSAESSTHSSPVRNTGAAFSTDELRNRFSRHAKPSTTSSAAGDTGGSSVAAATPRSRFGSHFQFNSSLIILIIHQYNQLLIICFFTTLFYIIHVISYFLSD